MLGAVVDVVALCGGEGGLEIGDAVAHEDVVPLQELADVAVVYALAVVVGQHFGEEVAQLLGGGFLIVERAGLQFGFLAKVLQDLPEGDIVAIGVHSDVAKAGDAVGAKGGHALACFVKCFYDKVHLAAAHEAIEAWLAGD